MALVVLLAGCAQAEEATRSAVEEAARDAVAEATAGTATAGREVARQRAQGAVDEALASVPGTCADVVSLPSSIRLENAEVVLRAFWLGELSTAQPSAELVEQFADAVVARCEDSRETAAADVISEVWDTGAYAP